MSQIDIEVIPPIGILTQAYDIGPPGGVITIPLVAIGNDGYYWFSFMADVDWWVLFGESAAEIADPVIGAVTPAVGTAKRWPANFEVQRKLHAKYGTLKVVAQKAGILDLHVASHPGGDGY